MSILDHGPNGQFVSRVAVIDAWLPELLDSRRYGTESASLVVTLDRAANWCLRRAAERYELAASNLSEQSTDNGIENARWQARGAERWFQRRAILLEALRKIEEVR